MPETFTDLERFTWIQKEVFDHFCASDLYKDEAACLNLTDWAFQEITQNTEQPELGIIHISVESLRLELVKLASVAFAAVTAIEVACQDVDRYQDILYQARRLYLAKNSDYGDSYKGFGSAGVIIRLVDKINRLKTIYQQDHGLKVWEAPRDTWMDLGNYAIMAVLLIDQRK